MPLRSRSHLAAWLLIFGGLTLLIATSAEAQSRDGKFVLASDGSLLWVEVPVDNESNVVYRSPGGVDTNLVNEGDCVADCGGTQKLLNGVGAFPHLSSNGTAVFKGNFDVAAGTDDHSASGLFLQGSSETSPTLIARAHMTVPATRTLVDGDGDGTVDDGLCDIEPMPIINDGDVVAFGGYAFRNNGVPTSDECSNSSDIDDLDDEYKDIFRYSSGPGIEVMLRTNRTTEADTVVVGAGESIPAGTYYATDADVINNVRKDSLNNAGQILVRGNIESNPDASDNCPSGWGEAYLHCDDRIALLLLTGPTTRTFVAGTGADTSSDPFQKIEDGVLNDAGQVLYKAEASVDDGGIGTCGLGGLDEPSDDACDLPDVDEFLNLWSGGTTTTLYNRGDAWPGTSTFDFHGFAPHYDLNASGAVAFLGSSNGGASCDDDDNNSNNDGNAPEGNLCQAVFYRSSGGTTTEIARSTNADAEDAGGGTSSSLGGFDFEEIASRVLLQDDGSVYFMAENEDATGPCITDDNDDPEDTMIVGWTAGGGLTEVLRENALLGTDRILRIYPPEQASAQSGQIYVCKVDLDTDDDCQIDDSEIVSIGGPSAGSVLAIPTLSEVGLLAMAALLFYFGLRTMRTGRQMA